MTGPLPLGWRFGDGPPALFLHGGPGLSDDLEPLGRELAPVLECAGYTQRGVAPAPLDGPFTVEQHVADAVGVLEALGWRQAWLVGHSWGGGLAMHVAAAHPDRVLGLCLIDAIGADGDGGWSALDRALLARVPEAERVRADELDARLTAGELGPEAAVELVRLSWPYYFSDPASAPPMPELQLNAAAHAAGRASYEEHGRRGTVATALAHVGFDAVVVHGRDDPLPERVAYHTAELLHARLTLLDGCGHLPWLERPGVVREALARLL